VKAFSALLEHHCDDQELTKLCGRCLQQILKILPYDSVIINMINLKILARSVEVVEFPEVVDDNKELFTDIMTRLCLNCEEFSKFFEEGVVKLVDAFFKDIVKADWDTLPEKTRKLNDGYIRLGAALVSNNAS
jgi:hypothetical protein